MAGSTASRFLGLLALSAMTAVCGEVGDNVGVDPEPKAEMTASEAEAVAGGIAGVGILSADGVSLSNQFGQLVNQSVPCPVGGIMEITNGGLLVVDGREMSFTMQSNAQMTPIDCAFALDSGGRIGISGDPSLEHAGRLASDSTHLHVDVRESGNIAWSVGSRSSACRMNIHTTSTISLTDPPPSSSHLPMAPPASERHYCMKGAVHKALDRAG